MDPIITAALIGALTDLWAWVRTEKAWITGSIGSLGGLWIGHRMSLSRERRTERNSDAQLLRRLILPMIESSSPGIATRLSRLDIDPLRQHLGWRDRRSMDGAYQRYQQACDACTSQDAVGQAICTDPQEVHAALREILRLTRRV